MVELLIDKGADINELNSGGGTPLHCAAWGGKTETVALLLRKGAKVNARDEDGGTPLDYARDTKTSELLKQHGGVE